jgi:hypothetical protein
LATAAPDRFPISKDSPIKVFRMLRASLASLAIFAGLCQAARADEKSATAEVSFFKDVLPILRQKNCTGCHQPAKRGGEYVMTEFAALLKGGESGEPAVVPGHPEKSYLIGQITPDGDTASMPKDAKPLSATEIATIAGSSREQRTTRRPATGPSTTPTIRQSTWPPPSSSRSSFLQRATCWP